MRRMSVTVVVLILSGCAVFASASARRGGAKPPDPAPSVTPALTAPSAATSEGGECGTITYRDGVLQDEVAARAARDCFWQGYQQCTMGGMSALSVRELLVTQHTDMSGVETGTPGTIIDVTRTTSTNFRALPGVDACDVRVAGSVLNGARTATGTHVPYPGNYALPPVVCALITRDANDALHAEGCAGARPTIRVP